MVKLLLNANLSPQTADFLRKQGYDILCLLEKNLGEVTDEEMVELANEQDRVIVTFDLDFGQIFHKKRKGDIGLIVLRLRNQTVESVNEALGRFLSKKHNVYKGKKNDSGE